MRPFRLRTDHERSVVNGFALPLGIEAIGLQPPMQGYTLELNPPVEEDEPETLAFHVVVSHERVRTVIRRAFELLGPTVTPIVEIGSRDAYRSIDEYLGDEAISKEEFLRTWNRFEPLLLEDATIAAGANCDDPFVEVFIDAWKGVSIHVPVEDRGPVESMLAELGLEEVPQTWPDIDEEPMSEDQSSRTRPVLDTSQDNLPDVDDVLLLLRREWGLELNIANNENLDESGRELGFTLWHAVVIIESAAGQRAGGYASIWATASSFDEMRGMIRTAMDEYKTWKVGEVFTIDRVAYDERPDALADLPPRRREPGVHLVEIDSWSMQADPRGGEAGAGPIEEAGRSDDDD